MREAKQLRGRGKMRFQLVRLEHVLTRLEESHFYAGFSRPIQGNRSAGKSPVTTMTSSPARQRTPFARRCRPVRSAIAEDNFFRRDCDQFPKSAPQPKRYFEKQFVTQQMQRAFPRDCFLRFRGGDPRQWSLMSAVEPDFALGANEILRVILRHQIVFSKNHRA